MYWIHLSDIHFNPDGDNSFSLHMRERLIEFLQKDIRQKYGKIDKMFITGDLRFAPLQTDEKTAAITTAEYIMKLTTAVGITDIKDIILIPGNHDLNRKHLSRRHIISGVKREYFHNEMGSFDEELPTLSDAFSFFYTVYSELYGEDEAKRISDSNKKNPHWYQIHEDCAILILNTAILCGQDKEEGSIVIGQKYIVDILQKIQKETKKPIFALAHHGMRMLDTRERMQIQNIFRDYGVVLYLCGHEHELWHEKIDDMQQINMGCLKVTNSVQAGVSIGRYKAEEYMANIEAYLWDNQFSKWSLYTHFGNDRNSLYTYFYSKQMPDVRYYDTLPSMFNDAEEYLSSHRGMLKNKVIFGYGMDLQISLPWLEKIASTYVDGITLKSLVFALDNKYISIERSSKSSFDKSTLEHAIARLNLICDSLGKRNIVEIKTSSLPYPFHGLLIDDCLFATFMIIDREHVVHASSKFIKLIHDTSPLANNIIQAFSSWFEFYWENGELIFTTEKQ